MWLYSVHLLVLQLCKLCCSKLSMKMHNGNICFSHLYLVQCVWFRFLFFLNTRGLVKSLCIPEGFLFQVGQQMAGERKITTKII